MATMLSADEETMVQAGSEVGLAVDELVAYVFGGVWLEGQPRPDARDLDEAIQDGLALSSGALEKRLLIRTRAAARRLDDSEIYIIGCNPLHVVLQAMKLGGNAVGLEQGAGIAPGVEAIHQALCGCGLRDTAGLRPQLTPRDHVEAICASRYPALDEGQPGWESAVRALATDGLLRDVIRLMDV
ncbi:MAG TPA: hypothetical protein VGZ22_08870 [Isosphaeraceae bacterium]|nr:hypothetical protein [Isosphaeraceae bacterium]